MLSVHTGHPVFLCILSSVHSSVCLFVHVSPIGTSMISQIGGRTSCLSCQSQGWLPSPPPGPSFALSLSIYCSGFGVLWNPCWPSLEGTGGAPGRRLLAPTWDLLLTPCSLQKNWGFQGGLGGLGSLSLVHGLGVQLTCPAGPTRRPGWHPAESPRAAV